MPEQPADHVLTVDADGHVLEPRDTWIDYIEPAFRDRAIRIETDDRGDEVLLVDGRPLEVGAQPAGRAGRHRARPRRGASTPPAGSATRTAARPAATTPRPA